MYISVQRVMESYSVAGEVEKVFCTVGTVTNRKVIRNSVPDFRNIKHA